MFFDSKAQRSLCSAEVLVVRLKLGARCDDCVTRIFGSLAFYTVFLSTCELISGSDLGVSVLILGMFLLKLYVLSILNVNVVNFLCPSYHGMHP